MATPTPNPLFDDGGLSFYDGPVPQDIIDATGETTWLGVYNWMKQQTAAAGPDAMQGDGVVIVKTDGEGGVTGVEWVPGPKPYDPPPTIGSGPPTETPTDTPTEEPPTEEASQ